MGVLFEASNVLLWSPSPRLAQLFLGQVRVLEEMVGVTSGIGDITSDEVSVNPALLQIFVIEAAKELEAGSNPTRCTLVAGPFAIASGLLAACSPAMPTLSGVAGQLARRGALLVAGMRGNGPIYVGLGLQEGD
jgi:hypothetical protein